MFIRDLLQPSAFKLWAESQRAPTHLKALKSCLKTKVTVMDFLSSQMIKTNESTKTRRNTPDTGRSLSEVKLSGTFLWRVYMFSFCLHGFSLDVLVFPHNPKTCPESSSELNCGVLQYLRWSTEASRDLQFTGLNSIWWVLKRHFKNQSSFTQAVCLCFIQGNKTFKRIDTKKHPHPTERPEPIKRFKPRIFLPEK